MLQSTALCSFQAPPRPIACASKVTTPLTPRCSVLTHFDDIRSADCPVAPVFWVVYSLTRHGTPVAGKGVMAYLRELLASDQRHTLEFCVFV